MESASRKACCPQCNHTFLPAAEQSASRGLSLAQNSSGSISHSETVNMDMGSDGQEVENAELQLDSQKKSDLSLRKDKDRVSNNEIDDLRITSPLPEQIGEYRIIGEIARGGMGIVYLAEQKKLRRTVALKVLHARDGASGNDISRFMREAKAAAGLTHPNIVPIHELSVYQNIPFFTMDYIEGPSLESFIGEGNLNLRQAVKFLEQIALAIEYAHSKNIIHRDLKPANIIVSRDGTPMLTDFGLAVNLGCDSDQERMTHSGIIMGTIPYIPPEQAAGDIEDVDNRSDIYSLGAILYELITGRTPFQGATQFELLHAVLHTEPLMPRVLNPKVPPDLQTICLKCLEKPRSRRYQTARELSQDCMRFLAGEAILARPATLRYRVRRFTARHKVATTLTGGIIVLTLASWLSIVYLSGKTKKAEQQLGQTKKALRQEISKVVEQEKKLEKIEAFMDPGWRIALFDRFKRGIQSRNWSVVNRKAAVFRRGYMILSGGDDKVIEKPSDLPVNAALRKSFSGDCRVELKLFLPKGNGFSLGILLSGKKLSRKNHFGYLFTVGSAAESGVKIEKSSVTLAEAPDVVILPDRWYLLRVERGNDKLIMSLNGKIVLQTKDETVLRGDEHGRIAFVVNRGRAYIDDLKVFRPGSSQQMLGNMLDLADNFFQQGQHKWAVRMAEYVIEESREHELQSRALRRCIASYYRLYGYPRCRTKAGLLTGLIVGNKKAVGLNFYLKGIAALEARVYNDATYYFDKAAGTTSAKLPSLRLVLLSKLEGILSRIRNDKIEQAVSRLTAMQRANLLEELRKKCGSDLQTGDTHALFLAEVDRLLEAKNMDSVWSFLEAMRILFPESGRDLAARFLQLSRLYEKNNRWSEALDRLQAARKLAPEWEEPVLSLAGALLRRGQEQQGLNVLERAAIDFPVSLATHIQLAKLLLQSEKVGNPERAVQIALRAVELTGNKDPATLDFLAKTYEAIGRKEAAFNVLTAAQKLHYTRERKQKLGELMKGKNLGGNGIEAAVTKTSNNNAEKKDKLEVLQR